MPKLSILIPSRNEMFLSKTVEDLLANIEGDTEILIGLDGQWSDPGIPDNDRVKLLYYPESIGQRAMCNQLARLSNAKYVCKVDAHCSFEKGWDIKMLEAFKETGDNVVMAPIMRNLHAFDWVCAAGHRRYQGPSGPCLGCGEEVKRDIMWIAKRSPQSTSYCFDPEPHFQYFNEYKKKQVGDLVESMSLQGSFFMMTREKYWELGVCSEEFGSWGSQGLEVAIKFWLSGGRVIINKRTYYAHLFRTQGSDFGFPYPQSGNQVDRAKKHAKDLFFGNRWPKQIYPLSWLVERFWPVNKWTNEDLKTVQEAGAAFTNLHAKKLGILGIVPAVPSAVANQTAAVAADSKGQEVPVSAMGLSGLSGGDAFPLKDISSIRNEAKMGGIATGTVIADMVKDRDVPPFAIGDGSNQPGIHKPMDPIKPFIDPNLPITIASNSNPIPTSRRSDADFPKDSINSLGTNIVDGKSIVDVHNTSITDMKNKSNNKGIIFYTDNGLKLSIAGRVQKQLNQISKDTGIPIVSSSQKPMPHFGVKNIVIKKETKYLSLMGKSYLTMFRQILAALEASEAEIVFFTEHDVIYSPSHFDFVPPKKDVFYYNVNVWRIRYPDGFALWTDNCKQVSGICVYRETALIHYRERVALAEKGPWERGNGNEPGTPNKLMYPTQFAQDTWMSEFPNLDIRHGGNLTISRWTKEKFRHQDGTLGWTETTVDKLKGWEGFKLS